MKFILDVIKGVFIGSGAILPGISSGVFCIIFGIYEKLVDSILNIFKDFKKLNTYKRRYEASKKYCMEKMKINEITSKLDELCGKRDFSSILEKIEDYINEYENNVGHGC